MLKLEESMKRLYVCCGYVDMRKGIEGLAAVIQIKYGKLDIMSYLSTGLKHGISVVEALSAAFAGKGNIVLQQGF